MLLVGEDMIIIQKVANKSDKPSFLSEYNLSEEDENDQSRCSFIKCGSDDDEINYQSSDDDVDDYGSDDEESRGSNSNVDEKCNVSSVKVKTDEEMKPDILVTANRIPARQGNWTEQKHIDLINAIFSVNNRPITGRSNIDWVKVATEMKLYKAEYNAAKATKNKKGTADFQSSLSNRWGTIKKALKEKM